MRRISFWSEMVSIVTMLAAQIVVVVALALR